MTRNVMDLSPSGEQQWITRKLGGRIRLPKEEDVNEIWHADPLTSDLFSLTRPLRVPSPKGHHDLVPIKVAHQNFTDPPLDLSTTVTREALASRGDDEGNGKRFSKHFDAASHASWASSHASWTSAESWASSSSTNTISKRNKQARYYVPIAKRPPARLLLNARRKVLERRIFGVFLHASIPRPVNEDTRYAKRNYRRTTSPRETQLRRESSKDKGVSSPEKLPDESGVNIQPSYDGNAILPRKTIYNRDGTMRRFESEMINSKIQSIATHRIDWRSRKPLVNPRDVFSDARAAARDREVASAVAQAAMKALEQLKRHETNVRRSRLRSSTVGQHLAMQAQMAQLLAMRRQHHERDQKRQCAQTIARWCNCERNDERLVAEGAVDAAARLALEDDDNTRKFSAISLRTLATRSPFWDALLQPHVLSTFRELLNEDADEEDAATSVGTAVNGVTSEPFKGRGSQRGGLAAAAAGGILKSRILRKHTNTVHAVPRDAALALIQLTVVDHRDGLAADGVRWEGRLVEKGVHLLLLNAAERHAGMAEGVACALFNLTCVEDIYPQMERVTRALVQMPNIQTDAKVRSIVAGALRNIATHPALVLRMIEEGVVQRVGQLAAAALMELQATACSHGLELSDLPDNIDEDDVVRECCMSILLRFAHNPVVRIDMIHAGAPRAIFALLRRPSSTRSSVARVAGRAATTLALLSEAPGAHDILERDRSARTLAQAVQSTMANGPTGKVPASMRAAMQGTRAASMWASAAAGRASLARTYTRKEQHEHSREAKCGECGSCAAHDLLRACLGDGANPATCRSFVRHVDEARHDKALRFALLTLALLLSDTVHGVALLASSVRSGALTTVVQMCCHHEVHLPIGLWHFDDKSLRPTSAGSNHVRGHCCESLRQEAIVAQQQPEVCVLENLDESLSKQQQPKHPHSSGVAPNFGGKTGSRGLVGLPSKMPLNKALIGACALVFERVTAFQLVREDDTVSRALVPGIVRLAQRVRELITKGWVTGGIGAPNMDSPPWCLACCAAALGRLAVKENALFAARISTAPGTLAVLVDTLQLHVSALTIPENDVHCVNSGMRTLVALREVALEPNAILDVARAVIPAALRWYETVDVGARAAAASLFTVFSFDELCRTFLLEHNILNVLLKVTLRSNRKSQERIVVSFDKQPANSDGGSEFQLDWYLKDKEEESTSSREHTTQKLPCARDFVAQSRLCCAITLANLSLEPLARRAMVFAKAAQALGLLSDTSYGEDNQLACAHALCNICSTVAEDGNIKVVEALQDQRVVAAVSMIGAVRASHDTTRRSCAAALANLLAPKGQAQVMEATLTDMNAQGLMPTLVRMCRVDDIQTRAYAACALARISATAAGRCLLTSRPVCLRVLFARTNKQFDWDATTTAMALEVTPDAATKRVLNGPPRTRHAIERRKSWQSYDDGHGGALNLLRHSVARIACRLILATPECCAVAVDVGALAIVVGIAYAQPIDVELNGETKSCITAIERCAQQRNYRIKLAADPRTLDTLAIFTLERNQPRVSLSAQTSLGLLTWDVNTREAVTQSASVVCSLVTVAIVHAREQYIPVEAVAIARALFCLILVPADSSDWIQVVKLGVLTALLSLERRRGEETIHVSDDDDDDDASTCASFEISTIVMCALRVIAERGAGSPDISLRLRNEGAIEIAAAVVSPKRVTLMKKPNQDRGIAFWRYNAFIRSYAVLYSFARHHDALRQKLDEAVIAAIHTVASGLIRCEETSNILRGWSVATLALLLVDPLQRNRIATQLNMLVELIQIARIELQRHRCVSEEEMAVAVEKEVAEEKENLSPGILNPVFSAVTVDDENDSLNTSSNSALPTAPTHCTGLMMLDLGATRNDHIVATPNESTDKELSVKSTLGSNHIGAVYQGHEDSILTGRGLPPRDGSLSGRGFPISCVEDMPQIKPFTKDNPVASWLKDAEKQMFEGRDLLEDPTIVVQRGTAEKNIVWCFFQLSKVEKKKTREVLQDATEIIAQLSRRKFVKEKIWLVAATTEAHRLLARRQYESNLITKSGTLSLLVRHSFRGGSDENESAMNASLKMLEDFDRLATSLQPTISNVQHRAYPSPLNNYAQGLQSKVNLALGDVPHESNDFFLSDCGGRGPQIEELPLAERMERPQNGNGMTDLESNLSDDDDVVWVERNTGKSDRHTIYYKNSPKRSHAIERRLLVNPWFVKMEVPTKLSEVSKVDEHALLDNSMEEYSSHDSSEAEGSDKSTDSESDYADFKFVERSAKTKRLAIFAEKTVVEDNWTPPHYDKLPDKIQFIANQLHRLVTLKHLTRKETRLVANAMRPISIAAGERFIREGDPGDTFYIIANGQCTVSKEECGEIGNTDPDYPKCPPTFRFCELTLLYAQAHHASVTAITDLEVLSLERKTFKMLLKNAASKQRILYAEFIDKVPLFKDMSIVQKHMICDALMPVDYVAGDIIFREGEDGEDFYLIEEGTVECLKIVKGEQKRVCPPLGISSFFGELALLRNAPRSATVKALEDVSVLRIDRDTFIRTIGHIEAVHKNYGGEDLAATRDIKLFDPIARNKRQRKKKCSEASLADETDTDSSDNESDYADFKFVATGRAPGKRNAVKTDRVAVEKNWIPPYYEKSKDQVDFLTENLNRIFFIGQLTRRERSLLVDAMYKEVLAPNTELITQGEEGSRFYVIEEGDCIISINSIGKVMDIPDYAGTEFNRGAARRHIGELALLYERPRGANVITVNKVTTWSLDRVTFKAILQNASSKQRLLYSEFIAKVPLFKDLDESTKNIICDALKTVDYKAGEIIIAEGELGDDFFIIEEGTVECLKTVEGEQVRVCPPLKAGTFFGELALLRNAPRAATVKALEDVAVVKIDRATFTRCIGHLEGVHTNYNETDYKNTSIEPQYTNEKPEAWRSTINDTPTNYRSLSFRGRKPSNFCLPLLKGRGRRASNLLVAPGTNPSRPSTLHRRQSNMPLETSSGSFTNAVNRSRAKLPIRSNIISSPVRLYRH